MISPTGEKMAYTIKEIADIAGVSTRTIRYYDEIGLLPPEKVGRNGYRYYSRNNLLRLQQILFYRELDVPLEEIQLIMSRPDFDWLAALEQHRSSLLSRQKRLGKLIRTVEQTISALQGEKQMSDKEYFEGFDESQYEEEVKQRWGNTPIYAESQKKWNGYNAEQKEAIKAAGANLTARMVGSSAEVSIDDADVQAAIGEYFDYLNKYFYTCDLEFLRNLADMWVADPRFAANYERVRKGGAAFVRDAVHLYCKGNKTRK